MKIYNAKNRSIRASRRAINAAELSGNKILVRSKAYVDVSEDDYEQGVGNYVNQWDFDVRGEYASAQELVKAIANKSYVFSENIEDYYFLDGSLHTSATVDGYNYIPTEDQIEAWKRGEEMLYIADLYLPLEVGSVHDMTDEEAETFGLEVY